MESREWTTVKARLREAAALDPGMERFGADTHRYRLRPPLAEREIRAFETAHGIELPSQYRSFVAEVGDGPAGPGHGLLPLITPRPEADDDWAVDDEWARDRLPGRLASPFPLTEPAPGRLGAAAEALTPGTLTLADQGCGTYVRLVLNGPRAGEIWLLDPDWDGFTAGERDFHRWYTKWLSALSQPPQG
ncbi:SMI1/KNR4 family protein SUKH-1 [Streptomyces sp. BK022]|uniref:SMI1/KNR4 family protein n=1 Tax=Streptomyces sp. BK022 TaxID=2512123 RepID=UPI001028ACB9|nr:SMI1/KNR4 family protein [Streptomyces sp. BK022]RZU44026.1 SMI1/KNR4 family protein SUKH-1 [Streptomyces sp. BK022]